MKRFYLQRNTDASGVSGVGKVAEGCQFDTGWCALVWLTGKAAMSYYPDIETLDNIHGHQGMTQIVWIDDESSNFIVEREQQGGPLGNRSVVTIKGEKLDGRRFQVVKEESGEFKPLQENFRPTGDRRVKP